MALLALQHLTNALVARRVDELAGEEVLRLLRDIMVGVGPQPVGRVKGAGQLRERDRAAPLVLAAPAWRRHQALAAFANGYAADELIPDVARHVGVSEIHRWRTPAAPSGTEFVPGCRAIDQQQRRGSRR